MDVDAPQEVSLREAPAAPIANMEPMEPQDATTTDPPAPSSSDLSSPPSPSPEPAQQNPWKTIRKPLQTVQPPTETAEPPKRSPLPDSRIHSEWTPSAVAMAKCDICDQRGRGTVYMCTACSQSVCRECCAEGRLGAGHVLDHASVSWDLHLATKTDRPKKKRTSLGGQGRGGRGTEKRAGRVGSVKSRGATVEVEEVKRSSNSSGLSDPPENDYSSPARASLQRTVEVQEVLPSRIDITRHIATRREHPLVLPRIRELSPRQSHGEPPSSRAQYIPQRGQQDAQQGPNIAQQGHHYIQQGQDYDQQRQHYIRQDQHRVHQDQRPDPCSRQSSQASYTSHERDPEYHTRPPTEHHRPPSQNSYTSHGRALEQYPRPPTEDHRPPFRNANQEPPGDPTGCPIFYDLRTNFIASIPAIADENRAVSAETHLYIAVTLAWNRGSLLSHLRALNEPAAFRLFLACSIAAFEELGAPRDHAAMRWLRDLEECFVAQGMKPGRVSLVQRGWHI